MKNPIIAFVLLISVLLNAAGIVFFILFLTEHGHNKSLRKDKAALERNLGIASCGSRIVQAMNSDVIAKCTFVSHLDGQSDFYAFQPPQYSPDSLDYTLVIYLHGMGFNYLEPFVAHPGQTQSVAATLTRDNPRLAILSCSYRKEASWGNDRAISDILQNVEEVMQKYPFKKVVLMGTSMGACVALNLAATAPADIKAKLKGVVSMEPAGDLKALWNLTRDKQIRPALMIALGGAPDQVPNVYTRKSFLNNISGLPHSSRIYLLSSREDRVIPPELQKQIAEALTRHSITNHLEEVAGDHHAPGVEYYVKGLKYVLGEDNI